MLAGNQVQVKTRVGHRWVQHRANHVAHVAAIKAEAETRFWLVNEFRKSLTDQTASFMPRCQVETLLANFNEKINTLAARADGFLDER